MEWFDKNIRKPIDLFSHPVWFIIRSKEVICPCCDATSKQPDPNCHICLGTGNKITLARVKASHQNNKISFRGTGLGFSETNIVNVYYTHQKTDIKESDIIVDGDSVDMVKDVYYEHSDEQKIVYWRIETVPYKKNPEDFKKNLSDVLKEAGF